MTSTMLRTRALLRRPLVGAIAAGVVLISAGTAAANEWLPIFQVERVAPVGLGPSDLVALPDLSAYGELAVRKGVDIHPVVDAAAAAAETGLVVPLVSELPRGVSGEPTYQVAGEVRATFTFSSTTAAATHDGPDPLPTAPPGVEGAEVRMVGGPGVSAMWSGAAGVPSLIVARAVVPRAFTSGVSFDTVRDHLVSLPGMADDVKEQLRAITADASTLPLPVPDQMTASAAEVHGVPATVLATRDRSMAAVVWVADGLVTVVAGSLDAGEVLTVASELR